MTDRPDHIGQMLEFAESLTLPNPRDGGHRLPFALHGFQKRLLEHCEEFRFAAVSSMRGAGLSSCGAAWLIWRAMRDPGCRIIALLPVRRHAEEFRNRLEEMAGGLGWNEAADGTGAVEFANGSRIETLPLDGLPGSVAGGGFDIFYIENLTMVMPEAAKSAWDIVKAGLAIAASDTRCVVASTPVAHFDSEGRMVRHVFDEIVRRAECPNDLRLRKRESRTIRGRIRAAWKALKAALRMGSPERTLEASLRRKSPVRFPHMGFVSCRVGWPHVDIAQMDADGARETIGLIGLPTFLCSYMGVNVSNNEEVARALDTLEFTGAAGCLGECLAQAPVPPRSRIPEMLERRSPGPVGPPFPIRGIPAAEAWS